MELKDRARDIRPGGRARMLVARLRLAERNRKRLRSENEALRRKLDDIDAERGRWMDALEELTRRPVTVKERRHLVSRSLMVAAAAGTAYVMGAKAGRERYEQVRSWWERLRSTADPGPPTRRLTAATDRFVSSSGRTTPAEVPPSASLEVDEGILGTA